MVIYATKKAFERYNLKMPEEMHSSFAVSVSRAIIKKGERRPPVRMGRQAFLFL